MDPATIGLLISIAPTVLDLLFGHGVTFGHVRRTNIIKHETLLENPSDRSSRTKYNKMYGYGLEGYGYRYPPLPEEFIGLPIQTKYGIVVRHVRLPSKKWAAAYFLNKKAVANNKWVKFLQSKMDELRKEYYLKKGYAEEKIPQKIKRMRHKLMYEAIKQIPELAPLETLSEEDLLKIYYEGVLPRKREKTKVSKTLELPKK
jgi:hypothetical protein